MNGFAIKKSEKDFFSSETSKASFAIIIRLEADAVAAQEDIVQQFNSYMQQTKRIQSFVHDSEGYFRISYNDEFGISSAGIAEFGKFLCSSGYTMTGIQSASANEGENNTGISFSKDGKEGHVVLSTLRVY